MVRVDTLWALDLHRVKSWKYLCAVGAGRCGFPRKFSSRRRSRLNAPVENSK